MATWDEILLESNQSTFDIVRRKYLDNLSEVTGREIIAYYSSFITKPTNGNIEINDGDMTGFMNAVHGLDTSKGLDLILHTPGGNPAAAESIVKYLREKFNNNIRVIVPQLAMSAGTMMAFGATEILMGRHSSLGPIDPQVNGIPLFNVIKEFTDAKEDISQNPQNSEYWKILLSKYPAAFTYLAFDAIQLSEEIAKDWLGTGMLKDDPNRDVLIEKIINLFNNNAESKLHNRHIDPSKCKSVGLKIINLESDQTLQDAVLSVHHCYSILLTNTDVVKIIENNKKRLVVNHDIKK